LQIFIYQNGQLKFGNYSAKLFSRGRKKSLTGFFMKFEKMKCEVNIAVFSGV
jgi:hypothetical protein